MYAIKASEVDGEFHYTHSMYEFKENADFECNILNQLEGEYPSYYFYVEEVELCDNKVNKQEKVAPFYMYSIYTDEDERNPDDYNDDETVLKRYTNETSFIERDNQSIIGYSLNSYEDAKNLAYEFYSNEMLS